MSRQKVFKIELCFSEAEFDLDKVTESYVAEILRKRGIVPKGVTAHVEEIGIHPNDWK